MRSMVGGRRKRNRSAVRPPTITFGYGSPPRTGEELQPVIGRFTLPASSRCSGPYATTAFSGSGA